MAQRRETATEHIFTNTGPLPWRYVGVHPSLRPERYVFPDRNQHDNTLPIQWFGMARLLDGTFQGTGGVSTYGEFRDINSWLARVLMNHAHEVREIIVKKCFFKVDPKCKGGRTPGISLLQSNYVHLALGRKDVRNVTPDMPNVRARNGKYYQVIEIEGIDIDEDGKVSPYINPNADLIRERLQAMYPQHNEQLQAKREALAKAEEEIEDQIAADNPLD